MEGPARAPETVNNAVENTAELAHLLRWRREPVSVHETQMRTLPIGELLLRAASLHPDRAAIVFPDERCTYAALRQGAMRTARSLVAAGLQPGDHVGLLAMNSSEFVEGLFGAALAGCVVVPLNARHRAQEIGYIVQNADLRAILSTADANEYVSFTGLLSAALPELATAADPAALDLPQAPRLRLAALLCGGARRGFLDHATFAALAESVPESRIEEQRGRIACGDIAMIIYTSGTTSNPKGSLATHESLTRGAVDRALTRFNFADHNVIWNGGPLFHIAALGPLLGSVGSAATFLSDIHFEPARAVALMKREGVTMAWPWFPATVQGLLDQPDFCASQLPRLAGLMLIIPEAMMGRLHQAFPKTELFQACGMTETSGIFAFSAAEETLGERMTTQGKVVRDVAVRIVDPETGADCPDGTVGEILVRGYCVTKGYYKDPEKTATAVDRDGWLHTGDMYVRTGQGNLIFKGRYKDMLKVGGENVAAIEVEAFMCSHPAVRACEVVGRPDPRLDEVPVAFVETREGHSVTPAELIAFCTGRIARYKIPRDVIFMKPGEWPMSATKVDKRALRARLR
jgi:fatty-acyl-CoA synthase/long-chain acyl-CoA synthetase